MFNAGIREQVDALKHEIARMCEGDVDATLEELRLYPTAHGPSDTDGMEADQELRIACLTRLAELQQRREQRR